jgi:uncharacterized membrane protein
METGARRKEESQQTPTEPAWERQRGRPSRTTDPTAWSRTREYGVQRNGSKAKKLAQGLGLFSVGLGLAEILVPRKIANFIGTQRSHVPLIRLFGLRKVASGISIFAQGRRPAEAVWSRLAGDVLDLTALGAAFASRSTNKRKLAFATANAAAVTALDVICAKQLSETRDDGRRANLALKSLIINRSPEELYQTWRTFENLPKYLDNIESVQTTGPSHSHWVARAPAGAKVEWDAEITMDRPNERIEWHSLSGSDIQNWGAIYFERATGDRGTIVHVELRYRLPGGEFGVALAKMFGHDPGQNAQEALRRFKQIMEAGEVAVSDGTLYDNGLLTQRPAQPIGEQQPEWRQQGGRRSYWRHARQQRLEEGYAR